MIRFILILLFLSIFSFSQAQSIVLKQTHESGIYKKGETVRVTLFLNDQSEDTVTFKMIENFRNLIVQKKLKFTGDTMVIFDQSFGKPASVIFEVSTTTESASIGSIIDPEKFKPGTRRPNDLKTFWKCEKNTLRKLPIEVKAIPVKGIEKGYLCLNMEISCTGPKPASGYLAKPESAQPKSLPIVLYLHAAGVNGSWCRSEPENAMKYAKMGKGAISFDLNAHGMLNGQADLYYDNLENGDLKDYAKIGLESKKDIYFRGMYLRLIRTLDFLTSQPEWDGKRILVIGESQGGGQALAAAGFDSRVSAVVATVPAMCDWGGSLVGRKGSWPYPFETASNQEKMIATLPYFDVAHILKGSKATLVVEIGLIDTSCPASAVFAAINQAKGKKLIYTVPYRAHHMTQPIFNETWDKTVIKPKANFIMEYLK